MRLTLIGLVALAAGCGTDCESVCEKLVTCDEVESYTQRSERCEETCVYQEDLYEEWESQDLQDALVESRECVAASTCEQIADGECYDETLFAF